MKKLHAQLSAIFMAALCAIGLIALVFVLGGCQASINTKKAIDEFWPDTVMHKDGYPVRVILVGTTPAEIMDNCGDGRGYTTQHGFSSRGRPRVGGCATLVVWEGQDCKVYAPAFDQRIRDHELEHCRGYTHAEMIERGTM